MNENAYVKQLMVVEENAISEAVPAYESLIAEVRAVIFNSDSLNSATQRLDAFKPSLNSVQTLFESVFDVLQTSEAIGRSLVIRKDEISVPSTAKWVFGAGKTVQVSFDLIPKQALEYLRYKALTIAGVESGEILLAAKEALIRAVQEGKTFEEFRAEMDAIFDAHGVTRLNQKHIETIFRTNIFAAYSIGQTQQALEMQDRFPLWRFSAIHDGRSRHLALEAVYRIGEGPLPPVDFNCRCTAQYLHVSQVKQRDLTPKDWDGSGLVAFDNWRWQEGFESWKESHEEALSVVTDIVSEVTKIGGAGSRE